MPRGPKGEKGPADVIGNAVHVMKIATGEVEDDGNTELGMWIVPSAAAARVGAVSPSAMMSYRTDRRQHHRNSHDVAE